MGMTLECSAYLLCLTRTQIRAVERNGLQLGLHVVIFLVSSVDILLTSLQQGLVAVLGMTKMIRCSLLDRVRPQPLLDWGVLLVCHGRLDFIKLIVFKQSWCCLSR